MDAKVVIAIGAAYAGIYYLAARRLLFELKDADQEYFKYLGAKGGVGQSNSSAVIAMILDSSVPKEFWPKSFKRRLITVRTMLALSPFVLAVIFFLL
ncbi:MULTISPECIES: hypothetical protein [Stenotrophomonas]|uniref:hypothetical protein n=1 Tax=Stenotrophomonas TaxID=40323 RepID=UPI00128F28B7|nr:MULTISPECIES: hypothetical protein [Stenotrophomonas]QOF98417.1 hypothetical protein H7691_17730 [Stenotrophomonas sp. CW117]